MNQKMLITLQITSIIILSGVFAGMFYFTDIYDDVEDGIVRVLCLSCIKLQPLTSRDFTFDTANSRDHPDFVKNALKTKGPVFIQYGYHGCEACDNMIENIMGNENYFNIDFPKKDGIKQSFETKVTVGNLSFYYIYINTDDDSLSEKKKDSYDVYDKDYIGGYPMFTIITLSYTHGGDIKPYYTSLYSDGFEETYAEMYNVFIELLEFSQERYNENIVGYK